MTVFVYEWSSSWHDAYGIEVYESLDAAIAAHPGHGSEKWTRCADGSACLTCARRGESAAISPYEVKGGVPQSGGV